MTLKNMLAMQEEVGQPSQAEANKREHHHGNRNVDKIANRIHGARVKETIKDNVMGEVKRYGLISIFPLGTRSDTKRS